MSRHTESGFAVTYELFDHEIRRLVDDVTDALSRIGFAPSVESLAEEVVRSVRSLTGYDRVMVYSFDRDGHGEVVAEG